MRQFVLVGLDPGATVGFTVLGLDGRLLLLASLKQPSFHSVVSEIIAIGLPLVVGCDKENPPSFVRRFSSATGARLISPKKDLRVSEKVQLTTGFSRGNSHERDALAAALFAYKKSRQLIDKLSKAAYGIESEQVREQAFIRVFRDEGINIADELRNIPQIKQIAPMPRLKVKVGAKPNPIKQLKEELMLVKAQNDRLKDENERHISSLKAGLKRNNNELDRLVKKHVSEKNELIAKLKLRARELVCSLFKMKEKRSEITNFVASISPEKILLKRLKNLDFEEFKKISPQLKIRAGDVLIVDSLENCSRKTIEHLQGMVGVIVYRERPEKFPEGDFIFISLNEFQALECEGFALVDRVRLESAIAKHSVISRVVDEYKKRFSR